jgi:hypothetical protein
MNTPFWINDPTILLDKESILELWPTQNMGYNQKLNAICRLIILLTIVGFTFTLSFKIFFVGIVTIAAIIMMYKSNTGVEEGFIDTRNSIINNGPNKKNPAIIVNPSNLEEILKTEFKMGDKINPFSNVLLTDIVDEPKRKPAPPAFNPDVDEGIIKSTKKMVQNLNPTIKNVDKQLFGDLYDNFELDQSSRVFYSTANTKVANDQGAFGNFLYGDMPSAKESNAAGNLQREKDNYRYTLY